jgi:hypothetical protein
LRQELTQQHVANQERHQWWKAGVRDLVMARCCALHNFRVRLHPWQPMV